MHERDVQKNSTSWVFFNKLGFGIAVGALACGIYFLDVNFWAKGYMGMGMIFLIGSSFMLSKTLRDDHEADKLIIKIKEETTSNLLREFDSEETKMMPKKLREDSSSH